MWVAKKPSNIALIKYMGKIAGQVNRPTNASLSYTLDHLLTEVQMETNTTGSDSWEPLATDYPFAMSGTGLEKYLNHLKRIKDQFGVNENFTVKSGNNFPADCGIASSASSFAALTECAVNACAEISGKQLSVNERASLSALGSGSSCRSFMSGWVKWTGDDVESFESPLKDLLHMVVIVGKGAKKVSSSKAHKIVSSSPLFDGRVARAEKRLIDFENASREENWQKLYNIAWSEFWDMHALFETSDPHFGYMESGTLELLNKVRGFWEQEGDGPLVTMDAGPNIHLLWRSSQLTQSQDLFKNLIDGHWDCLTNIEGIGFAKI